jgi:hypothetical protein
MAVAHEKTGEQGFTTLDGYWHTIVCSCGEPIEEGPKPTTEGAKLAASTSWGLHLQGA